MPTLPPMTAREVETVLRRAGFVLTRQTGHRIWEWGAFSVPVPAHRGDLKPGTLRSNLKLSGMTADEFLRHRDRGGN